MKLDEAAKSAAIELASSTGSVGVDPIGGLRRRQQRRLGGAVVAMAVVVAAGLGLTGGLVDDPDLTTAASSPESTVTDSSFPVSTTDTGQVPESWREFTFAGEFTDGTSWTVAWSDEASTICLHVGQVPEPLCLPPEFAGDVAQNELDAAIRRDEVGAGYFLGRYLLDPLVVVTADGQPRLAGTAAFGPGGSFYVVGELGPGETVESQGRTVLGSVDGITVTLTGAGFLCTSAGSGEACSLVENVFDSADLRGGFNDTRIVSGPLPPLTDDVTVRTADSGEPLTSLVVEVEGRLVWVAAGSVRPAGVEVVFYRNGVIVSDLTVGSESGFDGMTTSAGVARGELWDGREWFIDSDGQSACLTVSPTSGTSEGGCAQPGSGVQELGYDASGEDFLVIGVGDPAAVSQAGIPTSFLVPRAIEGTDGVGYWLLRQGPLDSASETVRQAEFPELGVTLELRSNQVLCINGDLVCVDTFGTLWAFADADVARAGTVAFGIADADLVPGSLAGIDLDTADILWESEGRVVWARQIDPTQRSEIPPLEVRVG